MKLLIFINKMIRTIFLTLSILVAYTVGDCVACNNCIANNSPESNGKYILFPSTLHTCEVGNEYTHFSINVQDEFNGCGYAKDINEVYNKCTNECKACQKIDNKCESFTDHPSSTVRCPLSKCIPRGESLKHGTKCCAGLELLNFKCINPKTDCTPCGHRIEAHKPCCDKSGIDRNGVWKCAKKVTEGCHKCKFDSECSGGKRCVSGCCS
jgi:hypothetical protein